MDEQDKDFEIYLRQFHLRQHAPYPAEISVEVASRRPRWVLAAVAAAVVAAISLPLARNFITPDSFSTTVEVAGDSTYTAGETIAWASAGKGGYFKGARKSTPYAAGRAAENAAQQARKAGMVEVEVKVKGPGAGREQAILNLQNAGLKVTGIEDVTPLPHNGCRPPKKRRV